MRDEGDGTRKGWGYRRDGKMGKMVARVFQKKKKKNRGRNRGFRK